MKTLFSFFLIALCLCAGCSTPKKEYSIAIDPSWEPLNLEGKEKRVTAFSTELLQQIGILENIAFTKVTVSWNVLLPGLEKKEYDGILSSMPSYSFHESTYDFSDLYLQTGPVLIVPIQSEAKTLADLKGKEVAVQPQTQETALLEKYPGILIRNYPSIPTALNALIAGDVDAALVDVLLARTYVQDLYQKELKMVGEPMDNQGLKLVTLHGGHPELIAAFNAGLKKLQKKEEVSALEKKWGL